MTSRGGAALYTPDILALAVELADYSLADLTRRGEAHSRVCGSRVIVGTNGIEADRLGRVGAQVTACAIGQAAATLFLRSAAGRYRTEIASALAAIEAWLAGGDEMPPWPGVAQLEPARAYPARHAAILLPWKAALAALSNPAGAD